MEAWTDSMEIAVQYQMKGLSWHLERGQGGGLLEVGDQMEEIVEPQEYHQIAKASWCPSNSTPCPCSSSS